MASTTKAKKTARTYYKTHKKYRENKIANTKASQKSNREEYNAYKRKYYAENEEYKRYKQEYAKKYRKQNPEKSKARKYRSKVK